MKRKSTTKKERKNRKACRIKERWNKSNMKNRKNKFEKENKLQKNEQRRPTKRKK